VPADECRDYRRHDQGNLIGSARDVTAEQKKVKSHQRDEAGDRDDRFSQRERLRLIESLHVRYSQVLVKLLF